MVLLGTAATYPNSGRSDNGDRGGAGVGAGEFVPCRIQLIAEVSLAKLFADFASPVDTSALMQQNSPPTLSKSPVPERETIPPQETLGGGDDNIDPVDPRESVTGSEEPGLPEAAVMRKDMAAVSNKDGLPTRKDDDEDATSEPTTKPCDWHNKSIT